MYPPEPKGIEAMYKMDAHNDRRKNKHRIVQKQQQEQEGVSLRHADIYNTDMVKDFLERLVKDGSLYKTGNVYYIV